MNGNSRFDGEPHNGLIGRVVAVLRQQIRSGAWPVGTRIPTEPELSAQTGVGRNTVREAVQSLVHAGLLERRQGSGTYVLADNEVIVQTARFVTRESDRHMAAVEAFAALWPQACAFAALRRSTQEADVFSEATLDLVGDPTYLIGSTGDLGVAATVGNEIHPVIKVVLDTARSPLIRDLTLGLLNGLAHHYRLTCPGVYVVDVAKAICSGDAQLAAEAAERMAAHHSLMPSLSI